LRRRRRGERSAPALAWQWLGQTGSLQLLLELAPLGLIFRRQQRDGLAGAPHAAGTPDAVGEQRPVLGEVEVDDAAETVDVEAARRNVGGDEDRQRAALEVGDDAVARVLTQVGLQRGGAVALALELKGELLDAVLGAAEDEGRAVLSGSRRAQQRAQHGGLGAGRNVVEQVLDRLGAGAGGLARVDLHFGRVLEEARGNAAHPVGYGGGEERILAPGSGRAGGHVGDDAVDVGAEAAVEHLVGLVEDEVRHAVQAERALLEVVEDAAGGADDDLSSRAERAGLRTVAAAADQLDDAQAMRAADLGENAADLRGQLARRSQYKRLGGAAPGVDALDQRQAESQRLARAGARLADDVAPFEQEWQRPRLDRRRLSDAHRCQRRAAVRRDGDSAEDGFRV